MSLNIKYNNSLDDVEKFKTLGVFENNIDEYNTINLITKLSNDFSSGKYTYVNVPLKIYTHNINKIKDTTKTEFVELNTEEMVKNQHVDDILTEYNKVVSENKNLNKTINTLIDKYESNDSDQMMSAMKTEIINLRIQLGQGKTFNDFSDVFPFLPN